MAVELATAYVSIVPSAEGIKGKLTQELNLDSFAKSSGAAAGQTFSKSLITAATATGVGVALGAFFRSAFNEAAEAQKVGAQTEAVIKSTGQAAHVSAEQVSELAGALSDKAGIDDEVIQSGENVLLTFTKVRNEAGKGNDIFTRATKVALDMSVALGTDLKSANIQLGKALNDPIKGITALTRVGVTFTEQQKAQIATLVESGDQLGAQKVILRELATEFGGSAEAQATSAEKAKVAIGNLQESIGIALLPAVETAANAISFFTDILNGLPDPVRNIVIQVTGVAGALAGAAFVASKFGGAFSILSSAASASGDAIAGLTSVLRGFTAAEIAANVGVFAAVAGIAALGYVLGSTDGLYERTAAAADKWAKATVAAAKSTGDEFKVLQSTNKALESRIDTLKAKQSELSDAISSGGSGAQGYRERLNEISESLLVAQQRHKALGPEIDRLKEQQDAAKTAHTAAASGMDRYSFALAFGATQEAALAAAGDKGREAIQNFQNTLLAAAGGALGYAQSQQNLIKAQDDYNAAVAEFGPSSKEAAAAQLALNQAQLANVQAAQSADQAQQALIQSLVSGNTTYDAQLALLQEQIRLHPENAAGIQLEIDKLNAAKDAADKIPGSKTIKVDVQAEAALETLARVNRAINDVVTGITGSLFGGPPGKMAGGPVTAGNPFIVGEAGPELFVPKSSGTIIPHDQTMALAQSGGGLFAGAQVLIGDSNVIPDLDYYTRTRMAGV